MRSILAVIAGYLIFAVSSVFWFKIMGMLPHEAAPAAFMLETLAYGIVFSLLAGLVCRVIAPSPSKAVYVLALLIFALAGISLALTWGANHWTQLMAMFIFAPAAVMGGSLHKRLVRK